MLKLFIGTAVLWLFGLALLLAFAAHHLAAHWFSFLWLTVVAISTPFAWHWFAEFKLTAGFASRIDGYEASLWVRLKAHGKALLNAILLAATSLWATGMDWIGSTIHVVFGLQPGDLDPFKDVALLHTFFADSAIPKIVAGVTWFAVVLHLKQMRDAAAIVPAQGTASAATAPPA